MDDAVRKRRVESQRMYWSSSSGYKLSQLAVHTLYSQEKKSSVPQGSKLQVNTLIRTVQEGLYVQKKKEIRKAWEGVAKE